jgi:hypothetical protein
MYNLQLNGDIITDKRKMEVMRTAIQFSFFMIIVAVSACISPFLYNYFVVQLIEKAMSNNITEQAGSLKTVDIILTIFFVTMAIAICSEGINTENTTQTSIGIILFLFIVLSISMVIFLKITNPSVYALKNENTLSDTPNFDFISILFAFLKKNVNEILIIYGIFACVLLAITLSMYYTKGFSENDNMNNRIHNFVLSMGLIYGFFIVIYIAYIIKEGK